MTPKYYESHITIEPVFDQRLADFASISKHYGFRVAELVMVKDREATGERSNKDAFCTGRGQSFDDLQVRMTKLTHALQDAGFEVWRYKIESILVDERLKH